MTAVPKVFNAVVLAGDRPGGNPLARAHQQPAGVLVPVLGKTCIARVIEALRASHHVQGGVVVGPDRSIVEHSGALGDILAAGDYRWLAPASGPAASAQAGLREIGQRPSLLTSGDHALLTGEMIDDFCARAAGLDVDLVVGLVPFQLVHDAYPESRRTVWRFSGKPYCGSNLYAINTDAGMQAVGLWSEFEADRKRPWRIVRVGGLSTVVRYLSRRLDIDAAFAFMSERAGCRIGWTEIADCNAAVDVDSEADWGLAERILAGR